MLEEIEYVEVIDTASNGQIALKKIEQLQPDLVTLDVEMPEMDGLTTLKEIKQRFPQTQVIMLSSLTKQGATTTIQALVAGAFDFIEKPDYDDSAESEKHLQRQLKRITNTLMTKEALTRQGRGTVTQTTDVPSKENKQNSSTEEVLKRISAIHAKTKIKIVSIGVSTGGPTALPVLLKNLSKDLNVPILIVQHMPALFVSALVESLNKISTLPVIEAQPQKEVKPNRVYIAPGGKQMKVSKKPGNLNPVIVLTDDPPENYCKPSADYLFRSISESYDASALGIIMTGMGKDGTAGLKLMKQAGATVFAQDEASSVVYGMAMEATKAGVVDATFPLEQLAQEINKRVKQK